MDPDIETKHTSLVEAAVRQVYKVMFPSGDRDFVKRAFAWATDCFNGNYKDYQAIDAQYHDLEHTMQGTLCFARILHGRHRAGTEPVVTQKMFELGLLAILLHDTGYLKRKDDIDGTGAKYTLIHVTRSQDFASTLLAEKGFAPVEIQAVKNMIRCTGVNVNLALIPFQNELEKVVGFALGTADLLGQMAAKDYVSKLPILYSEFAESARFNGTPGGGTFKSAEDLIEKTPVFWDKYVQPKIRNDFQNLYSFLSEPYPYGQNAYLNKIEENLAVLRNSISQGKTG
jgi:hypothetical protein